MFKKVEQETPELVSDSEEILSPPKELEENNPLNRLEEVLSIVENNFNLGENHDYVVAAFVDKRNKCAITLTNRDFEFTVVIKEPENFGL